jgi:hypothetical protein
MIESRPAALRSRSLRTGANYFLVVHDHRLHSGAWDKPEYAPGDEAHLTASGHRLAPGPVEVTILAEQERDQFVEVARLEAEIAERGESAAASYVFPVPARAALDGCLVSAGFSRPALLPGEEVELQVRSTGLGGTPAILEVEREDGRGGWEHVVELPITLGDEGSVARFRPPAPPPAPPAVESCAFETLEAASAWLVAKAPHLEGTALQFVLERESAPGRFVEVGQAVATVHTGEARAPVRWSRGAE